MKTQLRNVALVCLLACAIPFSSFAQRTDGAVGIGFQAGSPTGISVQFYNADGASLDLLGAWDLDDFFFLNAHGLWDSHLGNSEVVHVYYGPGAFIGFYDRGNGEVVDGDDNIDFGLSGRLGLNVLAGPVEFFGHVTPRIGILENTDLEIGGGGGIRFWF